MDPHSSAEAIGRGIGLILFGTPTVLGIVKCIQMMRRESTSSLCVSSLLLFLIIWVLSMLITAFGSVFENYHSVLYTIFSLLLVITSFTGLILGIVGLALYGQHGQKFTQGRKQAWWGVSLHGLLVIIFMVSLSRMLWMQNRQAIEISKSPTIEQSEEIVDKKHNFAIRTPGANWKKANGSTFGPSVHLLLVHANPELYQMLASDEIPDDETLNLDALVSCWKGEFEAKSKWAKTMPESHQTINGKEFVHFTATTRMEGIPMPLAYDCWCTIQEGRFYKLIGYGAESNQTEIQRNTLEFVNQFRVLGPKLLDDPSVPLLKDVTNHPWGFTTKLTGLGWRTWAGQAKNFPCAVFAANHPKHGYLGIVPLPIQSTPIEMADAATALLIANGGLSWSKDMLSQKPIKLDGAIEAMHASAEKDVSGVPIHYELRIVRAEHRYLLLLAWANKKAIQDSTLLIQSLDAISINRLDALPDLTKSTNEQKHNMALCLHQCGLAANERQEAQQAANLFRESFAISQYNPRTLESAAFELGECGRAKEGLEMLQQYRDLFPNDQTIAILRAQLECATGDEKGPDHLIDIFGNGYRNDDDLLKTLKILYERERAADAVKLIEKYLEKGSSLRVRRWQAIAYDQAGDSTKAFGLLEKLVDEPPFDVETALRYGETANHAKEYDKASAMAERLIKGGHDGARTRLMAGWAQAGHNDWKAAKTSFEQAAKLAPDDRTIAEAIARASSALGEGDNSSLKKPIDALEIPEYIQQQIARTDGIPTSEHTNAQFLHRVTLFKFQKNAPFIKTIHQAIRLIDQSAIPDFSTLTFPFDPLSEDIYVNSVIVKNPDGTEAARVKPEEQYVVDESSQSAMATHRKVLRIAVPGLKAGCTIHLVVTQREKDNTPKFPWQRLIFSCTLPSNLEAIAILGDVKSYAVVGNSIFQKSAKVQKSNELWQAVVTPEPQYYNESRLPAIDTFLPVLHICDAKSDWPTIAKDYLKEIEDRLKPEPSVTAMAHQLTDSISSKAEKVRVLARHVQKEITYQGLEFGRRARRPNQASQVLSCHYGDCKDQALLLHQLLTAAGVTSYLALISTEHEIVADLPNLDQFNHMIVYVPDLPSSMIDTTGTHNPAGILPPDLISTHAFVLDASKPRIVDFPKPNSLPPDEMHIERDITFEASGAAAVKEVMRVTGYYAAGLRDYLGSVPNEQRLVAFERIQRTSANPQFEDLRVEGLDDTSQPLVLKIRYRVPPAQGEKRLPMIAEESALAVTYNKTRHHPFEFAHGLQWESRITIHTPKPLSKADLESFRNHGESPYLKWELAPVSADTLQFICNRPTGTHQASEHNAWYESAQSAIKALTKPLK